ncbi:MAG: crotonase/enoyl-CoA hydratase family protein [Pseudomonadota bacterium]
MTQLVDYAVDGKVAVITMDDQGHNLISPTMVKQLNAALDQAEAADLAVLLTGAREVFSAGFDLNILRSGVSDTFAMLIGGFTLSKRLLAFPRPVIIACNGHAIAMGAFLVLSADYRVGVAGDFKLVANEVQNGLILPHSALAVCRYRLKPSYYDRVVNLSEVFAPEEAVQAGFLDELVAADQLQSVAMAKARQLAELNASAFKGTKLRMRKQVLREVKRAIWADRLDFVRMGISRALKR